MNTDDRALVDLIAELRGLLAKASKGPWKLYVPDDGTGAACVKRVTDEPSGSRRTDWPAVCNCNTLPNADNATLIVTAINALPTLLDRLEAFHAKPVVGETLDEACKPWADYHGDLPDYDHPLRCVFESGVQYAVELLAKELGVEHWEICDGTEEFDGDLGGTLMNIVREAMPKDAHGEAMWPSEVRAALQSPHPVVGEDKLTMTIRLTDDEQAAIERLMEEHELSRPQIFRCALRSYQADHERRKAGETVTWSGDAQRARDFAGPLATPATAQGDVREALSTLYGILADADGDNAWEAIQRGQMLITSALTTLGTPHPGQGGQS